MKKLIILVAALMLFVWTGCASEPVNTTPQTQPAPTEEPLELAPDFTVYDSEGNSVKLSDFRGKPVVLNFWASWCGPCKAEMPDFEEAFKTYGDKIHFVMVNMTDGNSETVESASDFIAKSGYTFPVYFDTDSHAAAQYGIRSIPCTYFLDGAGYAVAMGSGTLQAEEIARGISMILP